MDEIKKAQDTVQMMHQNMHELIKDGASKDIINEQVDNIYKAKQKLESLKKYAANAPSWNPSERHEQHSNPNLNIAGAVKAIANRQSLPKDMEELNAEGMAEARSMGVNVENNANSFFIPARALEKTKVFNTVSTESNSGGKAVPSNFGGYIDALRNATVLGQLGATILPSVQGRLAFAAEGTTAGAAWLSESGEIPKSDPTIADKILDAKRLGVYVEVTNKLLSQTDEVFHQLLMQQLINAAAEKIDHAGLWGGETNGPVGIGSDPSVPVLFAGGAVDASTNADGAPLNRGDLINMIKTLSINNGMNGNVGFATNAAVRAALQETPIISGSDQFIWDPNQLNSLMGYNSGVTNLVPSNITKGDSTALSALIFGNFSDLYVGMWGGIQVIIDPYTLSRTGKTAMIINHYVDVMVRRSNSFVVIKDIEA